MKDFSLHVTELEKSRRKVSQKDNFLPLSAHLFSFLSRAGENVIASNPFLSTSLPSKILKSPLCVLLELSASAQPLLNSYHPF